jgi:hypothetical protein
MVIRKNGLEADVGKVTLKSNADEALSDESLQKSNGDEALNDDFSSKLTTMKCLMLCKKIVAMKR